MGADAITNMLNRGDSIGVGDNFEGDFNRNRNFELLDDQKNFNTIQP